MPLSQLSRPILVGDEALPTFDSIPFVDVSKIYSDDVATRRKIAQEVGEAAEKVGFFYAVNPPVSQEKMDAALDMIRHLFRLPQDELLKIHVDKSQCIKGYLPFTHADGSSRRASYSFGRDYTNVEQHFVSVAAPGTVTVNQWPEEALPEFRKVLYEYYQDVFKFAGKLLQIFALALGLEEDALDEYFQYPMTDITAQYYPIQDPKGDASIKPHADYGGLTLLYQDQVGGLEVLNANGIWVPAPPLQGAYVVNTGSYMEVLSNGRFPATVHRAFGNARCERFSMPFFYNPGPQACIAPLPQLLAQGEKPKFEPQDLNRRTVRGIMFNRPQHPFVQKLKSLGLKDDQLTYDLLFTPFEQIQAKFCPPAA